MKLSEQLKQDNDCGDFGQALEGYAEKAEKLELAAYGYYYNIGIEIYGNNEQAKRCAINLMARLENIEAHS